MSWFVTHDVFKKLENEVDKTDYVIKDIPVLSHTCMFIKFVVENVPFPVVCNVAVLYTLFTECWYMIIIPDSGRPCQRQCIHIHAILLVSHAIYCCFVTSCKFFKVATRILILKSCYLVGYITPSLLKQREISGTQKQKTTSAVTSHMTRGLGAKCN